MQEPSPSDIRRLHPAAIVVYWAEALQRFFLLFVVALFRSGRAWVIGGLLVLQAASAVARYLRLRYTITPTELIIEGGVIQRWRRVLPRARIQSVDVVQKLRHRIAGVVELRVEVVGGQSSEAEGTLVALKPAEAERLREMLLGRTEDPRVREAAPMIRLGLGDLLLAGITGGRVAVIAIILGNLQELLPEDFDPEEQLRTLAVPPLFVVAALVAGFVVVSLVISLIATVIIYWGFTVRREVDTVTITRGLLDKRRAVLPLHRVQAFVVEENVVRRLFGLASVRVRLAGYGGSGQEVDESSMLLPIAARARAFETIAGLLPTPVDIGAVRLDPAPRRALSKRVVRAVVAAAAVGTATTIVGGPVGALGFLSFVPALAAAWESWRALGHALDGAYAVTRSGVLVRRTTVVAVPNVQIVELRATPFQRRRALATIRLRVPKASADALDIDASHAGAHFAAMAAALTSPPSPAAGRPTPASPQTSSTPATAGERAVDRPTQQGAGE